MRTEPISSGYLSFKNAEKMKDSSQSVSAPERAPSPPKKDRLQLVTAAVAIASLGLSAVALSRRNKNSAEAGAEALKKELEQLKTELANKTSNADIQSKLDALAERIGNLENSGLKNELLGHINSLRDTLNGVSSVVSSVTTSKTGFPSTVVNINGRDFALANVLNPLKSKEQLINEAKEKQIPITEAFSLECEEKSKPLREMYSVLESEAAKRLFGVSENLKSVPDHGIIRIPSSEFKGFASTGGMAVVPKEIADNIAKIVAGKQDLSIIVDIPLYRGAIQKSAVGVDEVTERYTDLVPQLDGTYRYVQNVIKTKNGEKIENTTSTIATLKKIDSMDLKILTDTQETIQKVDMYMGEYKTPLDYNALSEGFTKKVQDMINSMNPGETKELGVLEIVKDNDGNIKAFAKIRTMFYDNGKGGKFDLNVPVDQTTDIYNNVAIASGETERFTFFSKFFYENIVKAETARFMNNNEAETLANKIAKETNPAKVAKMEAERQAKLNEANRQIGADLILGNDWQSGPISAMMRQLTTAKKYYNDINSNVAEKLYNTPIVTVLHNAELTGRNWTSQSRILNILFGEHSADIASHSHMPNLHVPNKNAGLSSDLWNGLMDGTNVNPQMMAIVYSDLIIPVSEGYSKEITSIYEFGKERTELFKFRAREGFYNDLENLRQLAALNGIKISEIKNTNPTMIGITNGADRANNTLTAAKANQIEKDLGLPNGTFLPYQPGTDKLKWHNQNKRAAIEKMTADINSARDLKDPKNPMQIEMPFETDLTGVTDKTPVFVSAGRIVEQKGLDILAEAIKEFYKSYKGSENPVFYIQGIGDAQFKDAILKAKREVAKTNPEAAKRIVFANLFSEPGRYDLSKLATDWSLMPSWFEPCGLSHKEIGLFSGAGSVVNRTGGLTAELQEGVNVISSDFNPDKSKLQENGQNFAKAIQKAIEIHADEDKYRAVIESMMSANFDWAREGGPIFRYLDILKDLGIIDKKVS